jgi:hypothetical protein
MFWTANNSGAKKEPQKSSGLVPSIANKTRLVFDKSIGEHLILRIWISDFSLKNWMRIALNFCLTHCPTNFV